MDISLPSALTELWKQEPAAIRATLFDLLAQAHTQRQSPLHTLTLATLAANGSPDARTVVFRGFEADALRCRMHTDNRSPKVAALRACPAAVLLWYAPEWKLQLRASATVAVHHDNQTALHFWRSSQVRSRRAYSAPYPPGSIQSASVSDLAPQLQNQDPTEENTAAGYRNFTVLLATLNDLEWLTLASNGNRRGRFVFEKPGLDTVQHEWLAP